MTACGGLPMQRGRRCCGGRATDWGRGRYDCEFGTRRGFGFSGDCRYGRPVAARLQPRSVAPRAIVVIPAPERREDVRRGTRIVAVAAAAVRRPPVLSVGHAHRRQQEQRRQPYAPHGSVFPLSFPVSQSHPSFARLHIQEVTDGLDGELGERALPEQIHGPLRKECHVPSAPMATRQCVYLPADRMSFRAAGVVRRSSSTSCDAVSLSSATSAKYGQT